MLVVLSGEVILLFAFKRKLGGGRKNMSLLCGRCSIFVVVLALTRREKAQAHLAAFVRSHAEVAGWLLASV